MYCTVQHVCAYNYTVVALPTKKLFNFRRREEEKGPLAFEKHGFFS